MSFVVSAYTDFSMMEKQVRGVEIFDLTFFSSPLIGRELDPPLKGGLAPPCISVGLPLVLASRLVRQCELHLPLCQV